MFKSTTIAMHNIISSLSLSQLAHAAITDDDGHLQEKLQELQAFFNSRQFIPAPVTVSTVCYVACTVYCSNYKYALPFATGN